MKLRQLTQILLLATALLAFNACGTAMIHVTTNPAKAEVYAVPPGGDKPKLIGETPLNLKATEIASQLPGSGPVFLEIRKRGFSTVSPVVTDLSAMDLNLAFELKPANDADESVNQSIDLLFQAQSLVRAGRLEDALEKLKLVEQKAPTLSATYEIMGGVYYIQKKYAQSLTAYDTALQKNPQNPEILKIKAVLENTLGVSRVPASGAPKNEAAK